MVDQLAQSISLEKEVIEMKQALHKLNQFGFTQVPNEVLDDERLKWADKGLFAYLWRQSDEWQFYESEIIKHAADGRDAFRTAKNHLIKFGYLVIEQTRDKNGRMSLGKWYLNPYPGRKIIKSLEKAQDKGISTVDGFSVDGKPTTNNTNSNNTNNNNTNSKKRLLSELASSSDVPPKNSKKKRQYDPDSKPYRCAVKLQDEILKNKPDFKKPDLQKWSDTFRLMNERDGRAWKTIGKVIIYATQDDFWRSNILSADKLRKQFERLEMQMGEGKKGKRVIVRETLPDWAKDEVKKEPEKIDPEKLKKLHAEADRLLAELEETDPDKGAKST